MFSGVRKFRNFTVFPFISEKHDGEAKTAALVLLDKLADILRDSCRLYEPPREKTGFFAYAKTKTRISFAVTAKLISAFVLATQMVQSLSFLNPKFQASSHLL